MHDLETLTNNPPTSRCGTHACAKEVLSPPGAVSGVMAGGARAGMRRLTFCTAPSGQHVTPCQPHMGRAGSHSPSFRRTAVSKLMKAFLIPSSAAMSPGSAQGKGNLLSKSSARDSIMTETRMRKLCRYIKRRLISQMSLRGTYSSPLVPYSMHVIATFQMTSTACSLAGYRALCL